MWHTALTVHMCGSYCCLKCKVWLQHVHHCYSCNKLAPTVVLKKMHAALAVHCCHALVAVLPGCRSCVVLQLMKS